MIYICTHKDFDVFSKAGKNCTIISVNELTKKYDFPIIYPSNDFKILEHSYSEGYMIKEIYLGIKENNEEWIGINHYRKYFADPKDELTLPTPCHFNMHQQYATCHNINDLLKVEDIINTFFPEYRMDYQNIEILFPCNMFIMQKKDFINWYDFVFSILEIFSNTYGLHTDEDVRKYVENNKSQYLNYNMNYQSRLHGFLMERLTTIFFIKYFLTSGNPNVNFKEIIVTQQK